MTDNDRINELLDRSGKLWQRESFDHIVRTVEHLDRFVEYIEQNPVVAGLCEHAEEWEFSSAFDGTKGTL